ncbi:phosphodiester glycosidase family protein [Paenibacillus solanacearum]|nr:phosphodiester glycosidase family protein [Paenibacillus solanacearum]
MLNVPRIAAWRLGIAMLAGLCVLSLPVPFAAASGASPVWQTSEEHGYAVSPGVNHMTRTLTGGGLRESVQMLEVDPANPYVRLEAVSSHGEVSGHETVYGMLQQLEEAGKRPVAGVNGDFFSTVGVPSGLMIANGELVSAPSTSKIAMAIMPDHTIKMEESVTMTSKLTKDNGESLTLTMINRTRVESHTNHAFLYNWRFGASTRTPSGGVEVVVKADDPGYKLIAGQPVSGTVLSINETSDTPIEDGTYILSATGSKADWIRQKLAEGTRLRLDIAFSKGFGGAEQVISGNSTLGYVLLKNGAVPAALLDTADPNMTERHPRTMVAAKQGKLYLVAVDGRQPGYSDGMTLAEGAYYLQSLGMENALNIDGGGSTTYYVREPGDSGVSLQNRPSDGHDRAVGNALAVLSTAPSSALHQLVAFPDSPVKVLAGSKLPFRIKGQDAYGNGVPVRAEELSWSVQGAIGMVTGSGVFTAAGNPGTGKVVIRSGDVVKDVDIQITDRVNTLSLTPSPAVIEPGVSFRFEAAAADAEGRAVWVSPDRIEWTVEGAIGTLRPDGTLDAINGSADGKVIARIGSVAAQAIVQVGKQPQMIEPFESASGMQISSSNAIAGSVTMTAVARPNPVRYGTKSLKLTYDFTGKKGSSNAYVNFLDSTGAAGREIEGKPYRIGLWVYGDSNRHMLRLGVADGAGTNRIFNLTEPGGLDWSGWKYVAVEVPANTIYPLKVRYIVVNETDETNKGSGVVYYDNLRAEYMDLGEDVDGPSFEQPLPAPDSEVRSLRPVIAIGVKDAGSGVDPASIAVTVDGTALEHTYDATAGIIHAVPAADLAEGRHEVKVEAADAAGTYAVPPAVWSFRVKAPDTDPPSWPGGSGLTVTDATYHSLQLSWNAAADNEGVQQYRVLLNGISVGTVTASAYGPLVWKAEGLTGNTVYRFQIEASDAAGNSSRTEVLEALTAKDAAAPGMPAHVRVTALSGHELLISFAVPADPDYAGMRIDVVRKGEAGGREGAGEALFAPAGTTAVRTGELMHGQYEVIVQAQDTSGNVSAAVTVKAKLNEGVGKGKNEP